MTKEPYERLRELRDMLNLSSDEMANRIHIPKSSMSMYINGKRKMKQDRINMVAKEFHVSPAWLMGFDTPMEDTRTDVDKFKVTADVFNKQNFSDVQKNVADPYYNTPETARIAQEIFDNANLRMLMDAARDSRAEDLQMAAAMLLRMKETNRDG